MLDSPFDALALMIAIAAFLLALRAANQEVALRERVKVLEAAAAARTTPPPLPSMRDVAQATAPSAPDSHEAPPPLAPEAEMPPPLAPGQGARTPAGAASEIAVPPPLPVPEPGFEERIGTRWVVWIGGLALALGGFFMVRYSIEAGLLGPEVRTALGGLFALALLAAGEWMRRKEGISNIQALPIANIPAILTAAGTAVAFATVYAAYALYGFLAPASAFILLRLVALGTLAAALLHGPALAGLGVAAGFVTPLLVSSEKPEY